MTSIAHLAKAAGVCFITITVLTWFMGGTGFEWTGTQKFLLLCSGLIGGFVLFLGFWMTRGR